MIDENMLSQEEFRIMSKVDTFGTYLETLRRLEAERRALPDQSDSPAAGDVHPWLENSFDTLTYPRAGQERINLAGEELFREVVQSLLEHGSIK